MDLAAFQRSLRIALQFLSVLHVTAPADASATDRRRAQYCYPLVGVILGALLWLLASVLPSSSWLAAALLLAAWVMLTGALHLDGLADCVDAWIGGLGNRARTLRILRDPVAGPMAVVALVLVLLLKLVALDALLEAGHTAFLLAVPLLARTAPMLLFATTPYVRESGLGHALRPMAEDRVWLLVALGLSAVSVLLLTGAAGLFAIVVTALVLAAVRGAAMRRLDGFTGDVAGATIELVEVAALVALAWVTG